MNSLVLLPLLAAACVAAPGVVFQNAGLVGSPLAYSQVVAAPAVQTVQVPLTQTVHYETKPVVTGYSTSIIKPAIAQTFAAAPLVQQVAVAQPVVAQPVVAQQVVQGRQQLPSFPDFPSFPPAGNGSADNPVPGFPAFPDFPMIPGGGNGTADNPSPPAPPAPPMIPAIPGFPEIPTPPPTNPSTTQAPPAQGSSLFYATHLTPFRFAPVAQQDAVVVEARSAPVAQQVVQQVVQPAPVAVAAPVVAVRAAQAGDFEPLVTKEKVLAPVRTHTQVTPQLTRVEPEVTVRRVVQEVAVQQPIYQTPVEVRVNQPIVAATRAVIGGPTVLSNGLVHNGLVSNGFIQNGFVQNGLVRSVVV